jgi:hypothetical protein
MLPNRRHALLIGIDRYPGMDERWQLRGCVNDVQSLAQLLSRRFGLPPGGVTVLENEAATRDGILGEFNNLLARVASGDAVIVAYAGHGSRVRNRASHEPDGWSETIVPFDSGRAPHPNRDIRDDEIYAWLLDLSGITPYVTLIFDSCFSGGIVRDPFAARTRWVEPDPREPGEPSGVRGVRGQTRGPSGWLPLSDRYVLLAAARHNESAYEIQVGEGDRIVDHGALSYFLQQELETVGPDVSHRDVFERVSAQVTASFPLQHPQMEGARDRELFGGRTLEPMRFLPVRERQRNRVLLAGGAAHGLTVGSQWAIYPQGTQKVTPETPRLGRVEVRGVGAVAAEAEVLEEGPRPIQAGDRAVESVHDYGEMRLVVEVCGEDVPELAGLRATLRGSRLLRPAEPGEAAHARVYRLLPRAAVKAEDPAPQLGAIREAVWAAVGTDGELIVPVCPAGQDGALARLIHNLEARARYQLALRIENRDPESRLKGKVEVRLLRRSGGEWGMAEPGQSGEALTYQEGDWLGIEVVNNSGEPVYVSVLDFGLAGRIALLYPVRGANKELAAGRTLQVGVRRGEEIELFIPGDFPFGGGIAEGTEFIKIFTTVEEADFSPLLQTGYRRAPETRSRRTKGGPLGDLLDAALKGSGLRETRPVLHVSDADWTAVTQSFLLRKA